MIRNQPPRILLLIGPGILVAATGVGAGDLATAAFTGNRLGTAVLWAVLVGAFLKFVLNEGLARWQLATGTSLLEGIVRRMGRPAAWAFMVYLVFWSFFVASALMSACGATLHAVFPLTGNPDSDKVLYGAACSIAGLVLVLKGGFGLFEKVMSLCIGLMFITVILTAATLWPGIDEVARGLFLPSAVTLSGEGLTWTVALMGGVGGTVTVLAYGYWIRESGRNTNDDLALCRVDLAVGYSMTALFGIAMVIIGSAVQVDGSGAGLIVDLAERLAGVLGPAGRWAFLVGAFGAVFSSLLGVWQSVPYLFADLVQLTGKAGGDRRPVDTRALPYRGYLLGMAVLPMLGLLFSFREVQKLYAVIGACFIPMLAFSLLVLGISRTSDNLFRNRWPTVGLLVSTLAFFGWILWMKWVG